MWVYTMKVIIKSQYGESIFSLRDSLRQDVVGFLNTLEANEILLNEIDNLKDIIHRSVNKK